VITFERLSPIAGTAHCVFKKSFWGRKTTLPATADVALQIFAQGVNDCPSCTCFTAAEVIFAIVRITRM
jgi:hypothetical protein